MDGISLETFPSPGIISASRVGVKDRRTHPAVENGVYSPILHPYVPNQTIHPIHQNHHHGNVFLMMWFIRFQRHFEIRMVITQALYDEGIKYSSNIDGFR